MKVQVSFKKINTKFGVYQRPLGPSDRRKTQSTAVFAGQGPELLSVVPGTEILPNDQRVQDAGSSLQQIEENRQKMASLKESLLSQQDPASLSGTDLQNIINPEELGKIGDDISDRMSGLFEKVLEQASAVQSTAGAASKSASSELSVAIKSLQDEFSTLIAGADELVDEEISQLLDTMNATRDSIWSSIPPEVKEVAVKGSGVLESLNDAYHQNPEGYSIVIPVVLGLPLISLYNSMYGGFSGILKPAKTLELLQNSDSILVDIRAQDDRRENGVPLLKLAARGKGVAIPLPQLSPSVAKQVSDSRTLSMTMLGEQIKCVSKINKQTRVIVMDKKGEMGKDVARACRKAGLGRVYFMEGGFARYQKEGLQMSPKDFYEDGPLAIAADTAESLTEETKSIFQNPLTAAISVAGVLGTVLIISNLHEVLKFIGVLGIEATIVLRFLTYDSVEDLMDDLKYISSSFQAASKYPKEFLQTLKSSENVNS